VARKPRTRAAKQINEDKAAEFLAVKRDLTGAVQYEGTAFGTATLTGIGTTTLTTGRELLALQIQMTVGVGTSATGTVSLNGVSVGTFSGGAATLSTLPDTVQTPINSVTIAVTATAGLGTVTFSAFPESRIF